MLFLFRRHREAEHVYIELVNYLTSVELRPKLSKVKQGRFSNGVLDFCGYRFAGGYVTISPHKITEFKTSVRILCVSAKGKLAKVDGWSERTFIKKLNQKINGFGHYYKYGHVAGIYAKLDGHIRSCIRQQFRALRLSFPSSEYLSGLGLRSLVALKQGKKTHIISASCYRKHQQDYRHNDYHRLTTDINKIYMGYLEQLTQQQSEIIKLIKVVIKMIKDTNELLDV